MKQTQKLTALLAIIALTAGIASAQPKKGGGEKREPPRRSPSSEMRRDQMAAPAIVLEQLELRPDQQEKLKAHAFEIRKKRAELMKDEELAQIALEESFSVWPVDPKKIKKAADLLSEKRQAVRNLHHEAMIFLVTLLDQGQHKKWVALYDQKGGMYGNSKRPMKQPGKRDQPNFPQKGKK